MPQEPITPQESKVPQGAAGPKQPVRLESAYFDVTVCRNCGAQMKTPFCGQCGQKRARRLGWRDLRQETWMHWRLFEISSVRTLRRLVTQPGYVARERDGHAQEAHASAQAACAVGRGADPDLGSQ